MSFLLLSIPSVKCFIRFIILVHYLYLLISFTSIKEEISDVYLAQRKTFVGGSLGR